MASPAARDIHLQVIREALEGVMAPQMAAEALFEALAHYEPEELSDPDTLSTLVTMHLRTAVERRLGAAQTHEMIEHIATTLGTILRGNADADAFDRATAEFESHITLEIMRGTGPVQLVVCARSKRLAEHLSSAVGAARVVTATVKDAYEAKVVVEGMEPDIFLFDGANLPPDRPELLAAALLSASQNMWIVIWSADMPEERALLQAIQKRELKITSFDRDEGVGPLIDLIRSRVRQSVP